MNIDVNFLLVTLIPIFLMAIPIVRKIASDIRQPMLKIHKLEEELNEFKLNNKFNRGEVINDIKLQLMENYNTNKERIAILESKITSNNCNCKV
uniref:Uncharacterized protein n=1 Tax=Nitrosopumivirus cobalaminus TaxID=3158414 RepID=A0AAU7N459_9VIRU